MKDIKIVKSITNRDSNSINLYFKEIYKYKPLTLEEELALAREHTPESLDKLIKANLKFVITVAKQYQGQGLLLEDLIQEGNYGLITAAQKFDPERKLKFISYAVWWIRQAIIAAIYSKGRTIRSTTNYISIINKMNKIVTEYLGKYHREPSLTELSDELKISEEKISELISYYIKYVSVDTPISDDKNSETLIDVVKNENSETPDDILNKSLNSEILENIINKLTDRESLVLKEHFGLFGHNCKSFEEIGKPLGLTGERVRQIKNEALYKLKERYSDSLKTLL